MKKLIKDIAELKKSCVNKKVEKRIKEFSSFQKKSSNDIFKELCFCILTANSTAERCIAVHDHVGDGFLDLPPSKLKEKLKNAGARFHTKRAGYITEARRYKDSIKKILSFLKNENKKRDWLVNNIKGIGYKEASHFLRNIGYNNYAIIDFHIIDSLVDYKIMKRPKTLNAKTYLKIEDKLRIIAKNSNLNLAELDLYMWYMETGKVLK